MGKGDTFTEDYVFFYSVGIWLEPFEGLLSEPFVSGFQFGCKRTSVVKNVVATHYCTPLTLETSALLLQQLLFGRAI